MTEPGWGAGEADWSSRDIADAAMGGFGLDVVKVRPLGGELDQNALLDLADGSRVVAKVSATSTSAHDVRWQHDLLELASSSQGLGALRVPRVIRSVDGASVVELVRNGISRAFWIQTFLNGRTLAQLNSHSRALLEQWGAIAAGLVRSLAAAPMPPGVNGHHWDGLKAPEAVAAGLAAVDDAKHRKEVNRIIDWFAGKVDTHEGVLPRSVVHHDLNDFNILATMGSDGTHAVTGVLDFADALHTARIGELAVAVAYSMLRKSDPLVAASAVVRGYSRTQEITDEEFAVLFPMAAARLCVNAVTWTQRTVRSGQGYGRERMMHTWPTIERLAQTPPDLAEAMFRDAAGAGQPAQTASMVPMTPAVPDLARLLAAGRPDECEFIEPGRARSTDQAVGLHLTADSRRSPRRTTEMGEPKNVRLGVEIYAVSPIDVVAPIRGLVEADEELAAAERPMSAPLVLRHETDDGSRPAWSRWDGLTSTLTAGAIIKAGDPLGFIPAGSVLRVSLFGSKLTATLASGARVSCSEQQAWSVISVDPAEFLGLDVTTVDRGASKAWGLERVIETRETHFARSQRSYFTRPMNLVGGNGSWLMDDAGRWYLDAINNVSHVGHGNARVVEAASSQMRRLNTNSRFVYPGIAQYAERLTAQLPEGLDVAFLVCTGSEANDLAVRMARQVTGNADVLVVDGAYHGNTSVVTGLSPNRYKGPGGAGPDPTTFEVEQPNPYRGRFGYSDPDAGRKYAASVASQISSLKRRGRTPAAFIAESAMGTAGSIFFPDGYLDNAFSMVREAGGLCIADEVQVGFGRLGDVFWGFEAQGVVPDIVTMGKPIGNGHPMAAVVTTREIADSFDSGMKYFNTFGGNPVSCAIGSAVLDEIKERKLQSHAALTGAHLKENLVRLGHKHELIGDVRGRGLYLGVELVRNRSSKEPADVEALMVSELMKDEGIIVYPTGTYNNVLKIKPPLTFGVDDADLFAAVLDEVLTRDW